ncbi:MAG: SCP-like extracellular [Candidatus Electrothrix sp. AR4]|nr:SCP-like extracellular [Candidatus Electrothrix sp. AR4]
MNRSDLLKGSLLTGLLFLALSFPLGESRAADKNPAVEPSAMTTAHNTWRSKTGVPDLKWSDKLADAAQKWADQLAQSSCSMKHSMGKYGENIYMASEATNSDGSTTMQKITAQDVVDSWGNEIKDYDYEENSCHSVCGHYTQVVWKSTTEVGCGAAVCGDKSQIWVCQYTPRGNMVGEKPY